MQYGSHIYLFTPRWADDQLWVLDTAAELDLDVVEISIGDDVVFTPRLTRQRAEELGLTLTVGPGGAWPLECDLSADDPADRAKGLAWHKRQVDLTTAMGGVAYAGALYGHPGVVKRRRPPADEYPRTAEGLHRLADYAAQQGVAILLEPMSHFRTHMVNTPDQLMHLIALADHTNLHAVLDTYHLVTEVRDYAAAIRTAQPRLCGVHTCENDRGAPGRGIIPWDTVFATLRDIHFDGLLLLEAYNSSIGDFAYERAMFHNVCPDGRAFVQEGIAFLRAMQAKHAGP